MLVFRKSIDGSGQKQEHQMTNPLSSSAQRFQDSLQASGLSHEVVELPQSSRTSAEAAQAVGCQVGQIAKSLVFKGTETGKALLVVASGSNRVNEAELSRLVSESVERPDADFVRQQTGFSIGGVPPVGHPQPLDTYIDEDLLQYREIWAAAGNPKAVFPLSPQELLKMTGGQVVSIK